MTFLEEKTPYSDAFPNTVRRVCERIGTQYSCASVAVVLAATQKSTLPRMAVLSYAAKSSSPTFSFSSPSRMLS